MKQIAHFACILELAVIGWLSASIAEAAPMVAIVANHSIDLNGHNIIADSYDSSDLSKSTQGYYDPLKYAGDMGDIVCNSGSANAFNMGNAKIYGHVHIGTNATVSLGPNGTVGEHSWHATHSGIEPGWLTFDANYLLPEISFPYQASDPGVLTSAAGGNVVTSGYNYNTNMVTSIIYPTGLSAWSSVVSNIATATTVESWGSVPSPTPYGTITNYTTASTTSSNYPASGTYIGPVFTNTTFVFSQYLPAPGTYVGPVLAHGSAGWDYFLITGYTYNRITSTTYTYPTSYTYTYTTFITNTVYITNYYDHILLPGNSYYFDSYTGSTYVAGMDVKLVLVEGINPTQFFAISKNSGIRIWSGGTSITLNGSQVLNATAYPGAFILSCAPTVTSLRLNGTGSFIGVIVAPKADFTFFNGNSDDDFCGALLVNSVTLYGKLNFHFDEALSRVESQLNAPIWLSSGQFQFGVSGVVGFFYAVEASTDFVTWTPLITNVAPFTFVDSAASGVRHRHYRSVYIP